MRSGSPGGAWSVVVTIVATRVKLAVTSALAALLLVACPALETVAEIVLSHQEHFDGTGYPRGLREKEICLGARIFGIVDAYDAMRSDRPYSPSREADLALAEIRKCSGTQFDPEVVEAFIRCQAQIEECMTRKPEEELPLPLPTEVRLNEPARDSTAGR